MRYTSTIEPEYAGGWLMGSVYYAEIEPQINSGVEFIEEVIFSSANPSVANYLAMDSPMITQQSTDLNTKVQPGVAYSRHPLSSRQVLEELVAQRIAQRNELSIPPHNLTNPSNKFKLDLKPQHRGSFMNEDYAIISIDKNQNARRLQMFGTKIVLRWYCCIETAPLGYKLTHKYYGFMGNI
ncbi:hypothetical protein ACTXT7_012559 [Hymenolepis weldensis]